MKRRTFLPAGLFLSSHLAWMPLARAQVSNVVDAINKSGRQRMLSQRMAKFYQAAQWDIMSPESNGKLDATRKEFIAGLSTLNAALGNSAKIKEELAMAQQQWVFFDSAIKQTEESKGRRTAAMNVATTSEHLLEIMDKITGLYQQAQ